MEVRIQYWRITRTSCFISFYLKEQYPLLRTYQTFIFWQDVANSKDARRVREPWKNSFASRLAKFDTTLKLLKITDQWYIVPFKFQGMRYNPLVIKWSCMIASKCHKKGYEVALSILPIPSWETIKQYRQATSITSPISHDNLSLMVQEMTRRGCKGIAGIHWDEMAIKEGIVLCKCRAVHSGGAGGAVAPARKTVFFS